MPWLRSRPAFDRLRRLHIPIVAAQPHFAIALSLQRLSSLEWRQGGFDLLTPSVRIVATKFAIFALFLAQQGYVGNRI